MNNDNNNNCLLNQNLIEHNVRIICAAKGKRDGKNTFDATPVRETVLHGICTYRI